MARNNWHQTFALHLATKPLLQVQTALHDLLIVGTRLAARQGELLCGLHSSKQPSHVAEVAAQLRTGHFKVLSIIDICSIARPLAALLYQTLEQVRGGFTGGDECEWLPQPTLRLQGQPEQPRWRLCHTEGSKCCSICTMFGMPCCSTMGRELAWRPSRPGAAASRACKSGTMHCRSNPAGKPTAPQSLHKGSGSLQLQSLTTVTTLGFDHNLTSSQASASHNITLDTPGGNQRELCRSDRRSTRIRTTDLASHLHRLPQPDGAPSHQGSQLAAGVPSQRAQLLGMPLTQQREQVGCVGP